MADVGQLLGGEPGEPIAMTTQLEVLRAKVEINSTGDTTVIAAVAGRAIRLVGGFLVFPGATEVRFKGGGGAELTGVCAFPSNGIFALPFNEAGWLETAAGEGLVMNLAGVSAGADGSLLYVVPG